MKEKKLILDGSLGHLQPFLRMAGILAITFKASLRKLDQLYKKEWIVTPSVETSNYLKNRGYNVLLLTKTQPISKALEELIPIIIEKGYKINFAEPYCQNCVNKLIITNEINTIPNIPENTKRHVKWVFYCPNCGKTYWIGSHWERINKEFEILKKLGITPPRPWQPTPPQI